MPHYEHDQPGTFIRVLTGSLALVFALAGGVMLFSGISEAGVIQIVVSGFCLIILALFHSLTVQVSSDQIVLSFGIGIIHTTFRIDDIESATMVQNRWYYGWGIKKIPGGWLYNVSGFDAVELQYKNGRKYRIGTDEPDALLEAIQSAMSS